MDVRPNPRTTRSLVSPPIDDIIVHHAEEAAALRDNRSALVRSTRTGLFELGRLDARIAAHVAGLTIAGDDGRRVAQAVLWDDGRGERFVHAVLAIAQADRDAIEASFVGAGDAERERRGVLSAFGWVAAERLRGFARDLLRDRDSWCRQVGLAACLFHQVDPGSALDAALVDPDDQLRRWAWQALPYQRRMPSLAACATALRAHGAMDRVHVARALLLLGETRVARELLADERVEDEAAERARSDWLLAVMMPSESDAAIGTLAKGRADVRRVAHAIGIAGNPRYIPWLIERMGDRSCARAAFAAFVAITGADIAELNEAAVPDDETVDGGTEQDEDAGLPLPRLSQVHAWWDRHRATFVEGRRYFAGREPTRRHCFDVLLTGNQLSRAVAGVHLCLVDPSLPLFNIAAPAWRQQRLLTGMTR